MSTSCCPSDIGTRSYAHDSRDSRGTWTLLFLDHTAELAGDRDAFLALCEDEELVPAEIHDIFILETAKYAGWRIKMFESKGRRITWREGANYGLLPMTGAAELRERGYNPEMSDEEMRRALREWAPPGIALAEDSLDYLNGPGGRAYLIERLRHNRTFLGLHRRQPRVVGRDQLRRLDRAVLDPGEVRTGTGTGEDWRRHQVCVQAGTSAATGNGPRSLGFDQELTVSNRAGVFVKGERVNGIPYLYDGFHTRSPGGEITGDDGSTLRLTAVTNVFVAGTTVTGAGSGATANIQFDKNDFDSGAGPPGFLMINNIQGPSSTARSSRITTSARPRSTVPST